MEHKDYCIYIHKNKINNKVYIGQTRQKLEDRWRKGQGYKNCPKFYQAIEEYGWNNFEHDVLEFGLTPQEADEKEAYYIALYNSVENGYNTYSKNYSGYHFAELWADEKIRQQMIDKLTAMRNTPEYHKQQSDMMTNLWKTEEYRQAQKESWTEERRQKISESSKRNWENQEYRDNLSKSLSDNMKKRWENQDFRKKHCRRVKCLETGEVFESLAAAAKFAGVKSNSLCMVLKNAISYQSGKHPETGEPLHWRYYEDEEAKKEG